MARTRITPETVGNDADFALIVEQKGGFYLRAHRLEDGNIIEWKPGQNTWATTQSLVALISELEALEAP